MEKWESLGIGAAGTMKSSDYARGRLLPPALFLIVFSLICVLLLLIGLALDVWLILNNPRGERILGRVVWTFLMLAANVVIAVGAWAMIRLQSRGLALTACILAVIPCLGPCFILGIPFGIWGMVVLNDPRVRRAFDRESYDEWD